MTPAKLAIVLLGLVALATGIPAPADAAQVLLFYSSRFVDTEDNHGAQEAVNLRLALGGYFLRVPRPHEPPAAEGETGRDERTASDELRFHGASGPCGAWGGGLKGSCCCGGWGGRCCGCPGICWKRFW